MLSCRAINDFINREIWPIWPLAVEQGRGDPHLICNLDQCADIYRHENPLVGLVLDYTTQQCYDVTRYCQ
jgi:hypothetical protein